MPDGNLAEQIRLRIQHFSHEVRGQGIGIELIDRLLNVLCLPEIDIHAVAARCPLDQISDGLAETFSAANATRPIQHVLRQ